MYIKNNKFSDEDTLFETLFDFEIGAPSEFMEAIITSLKTAMMADKGLAQSASRMDEESRLEFYDDILRENVVRVLMDRFDSFSVYKARLFAINKTKDELLYTLYM